MKKVTTLVEISRRPLLQQARRSPLDLPGRDGPDRLPARLEAALQEASARGHRTPRDLSAGHSALPHDDGKGRPGFRPRRGLGGIQPV